MAAAERPDVIPIGDFNADFRTDILWRNTRTGENAIWFMDRTGKLLDAKLILRVSDPNWMIKGTSTFDFGSPTDIVWLHKTSGTVAIWHMSLSSLDSVSDLPSITDLNWEIAATMPFAIVWRHQKTGKNGIWILDFQGRIRSIQTLPTVADLNWQIAGIGEFNGNGADLDILWRNYSDGRNAVWFVKGDATIAGAELLEPVPDVNWVIAGLGDYGGDGQKDIIWRHRVTGQNGIWIMERTKIKDVFILPQEPDTQWEIVGPK